MLGTGRRTPLKAMALDARTGFPVADGVEVVAFGDVHGMLGVLEAQVAAAAAMPREAPERVLVLLGDLIDRGPDGLRCIELAGRAGALVEASRTVALWGNHEHLLSMALRNANGANLRCWIRNGGRDVLAETRRLEPSLAGDDGALLAALKAVVDPWLDGLAVHFACGDVLFVHAGVCPGCDLDAFLAAPLGEDVRGIDEHAHPLWIRGPFLDHDPEAVGLHGHHGRLVVHGHSIVGRDDFVDDAERLRRCRVNLDAGSFLRNRGRVARLVGDRVEVVEVEGFAPHAGSAP